MCVMTSVRKMICKVLLDLLNFEISHSVREPHFLFELALSQFKQFSELSTVGVRMGVKAEIVTALISEGFNMNWIAPSEKKDP